MPQDRDFNRDCVIAFHYLMRDELDKNNDKPGWTDMTPLQLAYEMNYHVAKVLEDLTGLETPLDELGEIPLEQSQAAIREHSADIGNIAMFIAYIFGAMKIRQPVKGSKLDHDIAVMVLQFIGAVAEMRRLQRDYFATREQTVLLAAKNAENQVDKLVKSLIPVISDLGEALRHE